MDAKMIISYTAALIALAWVATHGSEIATAANGFAGAYGTAVSALKPSNA